MTEKNTIQVICGHVTITDTEEFIHRIKQISNKHEIAIQAINADFLAGRKHAIFAAEKAIQAFKKGKNIAKNQGIETLLYIAGTRQIEKALQFGIKKGENNIALIAINPHEKKTDAIKELKELINEDPQLIDYTNSKKEKITQAFNITPPEIEAAGEEKIPDLVLERVAFTNLTK